MNKLIMSKTLALVIFLSCIFYIGCENKSDSISMIETSSVTDIDGNIYKTVKIGNQWWMAEDLKVKHFRNGEEIPNSKEVNDWVKPLPACCLANENSQNTALLYNHHAVLSNQQIAPDGWHIPSDEEWKQMESFIGLSINDIDKTNWRGDREGEKLMILGGTNWITQFDFPVWGTDQYGFAAKANGCRMYDGKYGEPGIGSVGMWWSSTLNQDKAWYRHLDYKKAGIFRYFGQKNYGFSIRCVKD